LPIKKIENILYSFYCHSSHALFSKRCCM